MVVVAQSASFASSSASFLSRQLVPLLSSPFAVIRRMAAMAIGNAHPALFPSVLRLLQPLEADLGRPGGGGRTGRAAHREDSLRIHLSHIYRLFAESQPTSSPASSSSAFSSRVLVWVQESYAYLSITGNEFRWDLMELRRHFCVVVERAALTDSLLDDGGRRVLFSLLLAWCGYGPSSASYSSKVDRHAEELLRKVRGGGGLTAAEKVAALKSSYALEMKTFRLCALSAMAALLKSPCFDEQLTAALSSASAAPASSSPSSLDGVGFVFPWLNAVLISADAEVRDVAYKALEHFLLSNERQLAGTLLDHCYHHHSLLARRYFLVIAQLLLIKCQTTTSPLPAAAAVLPFGLSLPPLLHLLIFKLGDPSYNVRSMSLRLLPTVEHLHSHCIPASAASAASASSSSTLSVIVGSHLADTYKQVQLSLSSRLACTFSALSDQVVLEGCRRLHSLRAQEGKTQLLVFLAPWLRNIRLVGIASPVAAADDGYLADEHWLINGEEWEAKTAEERAAVRRQEIEAVKATAPSLFRYSCYPSAASQRDILNSLLQLTHQHSAAAPKAVEQLWTHLASSLTANAPHVLAFLLSVMQERQRDDDFTSEQLPTYKRIALYCSRASPRVTVWKMLQHIHHGDSSGGSKSSQPLQSAMKGGRGGADDSSRLRVSHFALLLLVEVAYEIDFSHYDAQTAAQHRVSAQRPSSSCTAASACQATFDVLAVLLHIGVLGLSHALPFIRHHSAILLINIVHATAFKAAHQAARVMFVPSRQTGGGAGEGRGSLGRSSIGNLMLMQEERTAEGEEEERGGGMEGGGALPAGSRKHSIASTSYSTLTAAFSSSRSRLSSAPSAGLSLAIAESQQMRVLGLRQRRALLLMNKLNTAGRSSGGQDTEETQQEVVSTLLRVVPDSHSRATLSRRWQHHAVSWGVGSPSLSYRVQSHRIYRALSPPLVPGHYWKCVVALEAGVKAWREEQANGQSLYQTLRSLQLMVERLHDGSASAAPLRSELLPCLLWSCVSVLHSAFSQPLRGDCSLLVLCIEVLSSLLAVVRDDTRFEQAVYDWRRRHEAEREQRDEEDDGLVFVGIQPLLMRCLLPAEISVYASFPCLNMITASAVVLTSASASAAALSLPSSCPPPPSSQLLKAVFGFLAAFTPPPSSPLAPLLDISSFAQRMLVSLITQLPFMLQALDSASASAAAHSSSSSSLSAASASLPCSHAPPHLSLSGSPELVTSCQSFASLFSGLGLLDLAMAFACCSCGHYPSSHSFLSALSQPLLQVLPASVVVDVCLLLCDVMERMGAFVAVDAAFHCLSTPRPARVYSRPVLAALQSAAGDGSSSSSLSHYVLTLICLLFSHVDWPASQLSSASSSPLFTRLHMLLHTAMAPLAAQALTIALHRADTPSPPSTAHQYAACIIQPAAAPAAAAVHAAAEETLQRYAPNPKLSTRLEDEAQDDVVKVVMAAADKRDSGALLQVRDARPLLPSAPPEVDSSSDDSGDDEPALSRPPQYHQRVPPPSSAPSPSLCPLSPPPPPPPPKRPSASACASPLQTVKASLRRERNSSLTVDVSITIPMDAVDEGDEEEKKGSAAVSHLVKDRPRIAAVRKRPSFAMLPAAAVSITAAPSQPERAVLREVQAPQPQPAPPLHLQAEVKTVKADEFRSSMDRKEDRRSSGGRQSASRTSAGRGSSSSSAAAADSGRSQAEAAAGRPTAKRSTMMALMLEQRDRKRREEQQRRDVAYTSLLREQQSLSMQHTPQQIVVPAPAPAPPAPAAAAAAKPAVVRTPPRMSSPAAAVGGGDRAVAGGDSGDVGSAVREEKRRREAEWAKVKERRHGIRERMREVGVKEREREKEKDRQQPPQQALPDWQRQSVLPCTFHLAADDEDSSQQHRQQQQQPHQVSMDDIMAGRVNYQ